jgi:hypothetical protein
MQNVRKIGTQWLGLHEINNFYSFGTEILSKYGLFKIQMHCREYNGFLETLVSLLLFVPRCLWLHLHCFVPPCMCQQSCSMINQETQKRLFNTSEYFSITVLVAKVSHERSSWLILCRWCWRAISKHAFTHLSGRSTKLQMRY